MVKIEQEDAAHAAAFKTSPVGEAIFACSTELLKIVEEVDRLYVRLEPLRQSVDSKSTIPLAETATRNGQSWVATALLDHVADLHKLNERVKILLDELEI